MIRFVFIAFAVSVLGWFSFRAKKVEKKELSVNNVSVEKLNSELLAIDFCGEAIPVKKLVVAKKYQSTVRNYDNPTFRKLMTRTEKRMQAIESILKKHGVPVDFKYIPVIESAMSNEVTSHKGAGGYWQFMPATARDLGLVVNDTIDERKHLTKSTHAAAKYLLRLHSQLGSWTLVAAAYNAGPTHIKSVINAQNKDDYYQLKLNRETNQYLYKLIAVKEWFSNPERSRAWGSGNIVDQLAKIDMDKKNKVKDPVVSAIGIDS
ncbi:transglycosylase-like protein with SLT domain [Dyadobacter jejuensis]|uniref:Transglycosylase-like protein with SLT domain n=1 Tax=Dyadobacter jejuensis TaxID=1082580 RepID=A0A316AT26_9BACT|nr:lytic transglycosylase domain-containing protein [Dyadobacter jejuensis]PWJ60424.1 transglycosylase-like protein with SLT domain [Dyadobacter jejuensis]